MKKEQGLNKFKTSERFDVDEKRKVVRRKKNVTPNSNKTTSQQLKYEVGVSENRNSNCEERIRLLSIEQEQDSMRIKIEELIGFKQRVKKFWLVRLLSWMRLIKNL